MREDISGNSPEVMGHLRFEAPDSGAADEFVAGVEELAEAKGVDITWEESRSDPNTETELFTWTEDPDTGRHVPVITWENTYAFKNGGGSTRRVQRSRATRFFHGVMDRSISDIDMDDGGYIMFGPLERGIYPASIRVIRSLELLRKLKNGQIGEEKSDGTVGIKGVGETGIEYFERYCATIFPGVNISKVTQQFDSENLRRMLDYSPRRAHAWRFIGESAVGDTFTANSVTAGVDVHNGYNWLNALQEMGYIAQLPEYPSTDLTSTRRMPFVRLHDDRWDKLNELTTQV